MSSFGTNDLNEPLFIGHPPMPLINGAQASGGGVALTREDRTIVVTIPCILREGFFCKVVSDNRRIIAPDTLMRAVYEGPDLRLKMATSAADEEEMQSWLELSRSIAASFTAMPTNPFRLPQNPNTL